MGNPLNLPWLSVLVIVKGGYSSPLIWLLTPLDKLSAGGNLWVQPIDGTQINLVVSYS